MVGVKQTLIQHLTNKVGTNTRFHPSSDQYFRLTKLYCSGTVPHFTRNTVIINASCKRDLFQVVEKTLSSCGFCVCLWICCFQTAWQRKGKLNKLHIFSKLFDKLFNSVAIWLLHACLVVVMFSLLHRERCWILYLLLMTR